MSHNQPSDDQTVKNRKGIFKNKIRSTSHNRRSTNDLTNLVFDKTERKKNPSKTRIFNSTDDLESNQNLTRSESAASLKRLYCENLVKPETHENFVESLSKNSIKEDFIVNQTMVGDSDCAACFKEHCLSDALLESEMNIYKKHLRKYDQQAKSLIMQFTSSLDEKGKIIKKYDEELSKANNTACDLQRELETLLRRTKMLEPCLVQNASSNELRLENKQLKQQIKKLEEKLKQRDLHMLNLKQVLSLETDKMKQLNNTQEEIINLHNENVVKSNEISVLRDELKYELNLKSELIVKYEEKISKMKKLLAVREYMLLKQKNVL